MRFVLLETVSYATIAIDHSLATVAIVEYENLQTIYSVEVTVELTLTAAVVGQVIM